MKTMNIVKKWACIGLIAASLAACKKDNPGKDNGGDGGGTNPAVEVTAISFNDLKKLAASGSATIPEGKKISGVVISDGTHKNIAPTQVILQEADTQNGLVLNFSAAPAAVAGDRVEINLSNKTLEQQDGEYRVSNLAADSLKKTGTATIAPKVTNAKELIGNAAAWSGTLVTLPTGNFAGGNGKYTGSLQYADSTGTVSTVVQTDATFADDTYPVQAQSLTGIVRVSGTTVQVNLRDATDAPAQQGYFFVEDFSGADIGYYGSADANISNVYANYTYKLETNALSKYPSLSPYLWGVGGFNIARYETMTADNADAGFATVGRNYLTVLPLGYELEYNLSTLNFSNNGFSFYFDGNQFDADRNYAMYIKSMTIVYAASKQQPAYQDLIASNAIKSISWNSANTNYSAGVSVNSNTLDLYPIREGWDIVDYVNTGLDSAASTDQGVWHTVKFDNLAAKYDAMHQKTKSTSGGLIHFRPASFSDYKAGTITSDKGTYDFGVPIIIDKIILEFSQKPSWWVD